MHNFEFDLRPVEAQENGLAKKRSNDFIRDLIIARDIACSEPPRDYAASDFSKAARATVYSVKATSKRRRSASILGWMLAGRAQGLVSVAQPPAVT